MNTHEYWIGKDVDLDSIWDAYYDGEGYKMKFRSMKVHAIRITFEQPSIRQPLFNLEAVYKTLKAYYHELKYECLSGRDYDNAGPLFLYDIDRGSGIWTFLGELPYVLLYGTTLTREKIIGQRLDNIDKKLKVLKEYFGGMDIQPELYQQFVNAKTPIKLEKAMQNLFNERIKSIEVSRLPFEGDINECLGDTIDLKDIDE